MDRIPGSRRSQRLAGSPPRRLLPVLALGSVLLAGSEPPASAGEHELVVRVISSRAITIVSTTDGRASPVSPANLRLRLANGRVFSPILTGEDTQVTAFTGDGDPLTEHRLHVVFARPLPSGEDASIRIGSATSRTPQPRPSRSTRSDTRSAVRSMPMSANGSALPVPCRLTQIASIF